jgi:hypothetical protein
MNSSSVRSSWLAKARNSTRTRFGDDPSALHRLLWRRNLNAPTVTRYGVIAVQTLGPLTLRREYEAGE